MKQYKHPNLLLILYLAVLSLFGCSGKHEGPVETDDETNDTLRIDSCATDTCVADVEVIPTKQADELFDDFVFAYMKNHEFQQQRTRFPLPHVIDGRKSKVNRTDWHYDPMYSQYEAYTLIFDNIKGEKAAKDTTLRKVIVETLNLSNHRTKSYRFDRLNGEWLLTSLTEQAFGDSDNRDFYEFYHRFATDAQYQRAHINNPIAFSTFDDDSFETIEGTLSPEQFSDFAPELPTTNITNILYGQSYKNSHLRVLSLRALSGGMECTMVFKKMDGEWKLTRLEN